MASFPFLPYRNYYNYYPKYYKPIISKNMVNQEKKVQAQENITQEDHNCKNSKVNNTREQENRTKEKSSRYFLGPISFNSSFLSDSEEPVLEILGIQLYLDDIIILGLLFFLYQEGVKDEMLFITLILLLLS